MSDNKKLAEIYGELKSKATWHQALSIVVLCCVSSTLTFALISATTHILFSGRLQSWTIFVP